MDVQMNRRGFGRKRLKPDPGNTQALVCKAQKRHIREFPHGIVERCYVVCARCLILIGQFLALLVQHGGRTFLRNVAGTSGSECRENVNRDLTALPCTGGGAMRSHRDHFTYFVYTGVER
jgi:hypothetical protein